jgi:hypothetical protein
MAQKWGILGQSRPLDSPINRLLHSVLTALIQYDEALEAHFISKKRENLLLPNRQKYHYHRLD